MLQVGADALTFELPAVLDGDIQSLSLDEYLDEQIVVLAFYPGDFNPACGEDSDLAELDLFAMQPDVAVIAVAPDTVFSHRAFAAEYDLDVALCADTRGLVTEAYEVDYVDDHGQAIPERAVFVVDLDGAIQYAWSSRDFEERFNGEEIQRCVADIGGDAAAVSRYRVGHAHYVEGRRAFTSAMAGFEDHEWMTARADFERCREEFTTAADHLSRASRFVTDDRLDAHFDRARMKATALWQAADWLADAADAFASGDGETGNAYRHDAETPLETARELADPLDPDGITVEDGAVSVPEQPDERTTATMDAIREQTDDGSTAGGVDLELSDDPMETETETELPTREGPDTKAAQRMREYAGVGMDMGDPEGAGEDQIADAVGGDDELGAEPESGEEDADAADVTDEDIEAIAEELQTAEEKPADERDPPESMADRSETVRGETSDGGTSNEEEIPKDEEAS